MVQGDTVMQTCAGTRCVPCASTAPIWAATSTAVQTSHRGRGAKRGIFKNLGGVIRRACVIRVSKLIARCVALHVPSRTCSTSGGKQCAAAAVSRARVEVVGTGVPASGLYTHGSVYQKTSMDVLAGQVNTHTANACAQGAVLAGCLQNCLFCV